MNAQPRVVLDARRAVDDAEASAALEALAAAWGAAPRRIDLAIAVGAWSVPVPGSVRWCASPREAGEASLIHWLASDIGAPAFGSARLAVVPTRHAKVQLQTLRRYPAHRTLTIPWGYEAPATMVCAERPLVVVRGGTADSPLGRWQRELDGLGPLRLLAPNAPAAQRRAAVAEAGVVVVLDHEMAFGTALWEALAAGRPVVASDLPPLNEAPRARVHWADADQQGSLRAAVEAALATQHAQPLGARLWSMVADQLEAVLEDPTWLSKDRGFRAKA